jgi:predicted transcriptional regulator
MHDQPTGRRVTATVEDIQRSLLGLLLEPDDQRPWSIAELARQLTTGDNQAIVEDAVATLHGVGLINRADDLASAGRPAIHIQQLGLLAV